ncbi:MAG: DUF4390 domain-containing protein [Gammaproteobacteria bacterium]
MIRYATCTLLVLGLVTIVVPPAQAKSAFEVVSLSTQLDKGVYYLDADMRLNLNRRAHQALANGVALTFVIPIHIQHSRLWLWNVVVAHLSERYRLRYFPLTERYRIVNLNGGAKKSYATLADALSAIGHIRHLPIIDASLLDKHTRYYVAMRVVLDTKQLPGPLKVAAEVVPGWQQSSKWRVERLTP